MAHDAGHGQCETVINWGEGFVLFTGILFESCKSDDWMGEVGTVVDNACVESENHGARTPRNGRHDTLYKCDVHLSSCINSSPPTPPAARLDISTFPARRNTARLLPLLFLCSPDATAILHASRGLPLRALEAYGQEAACPGDVFRCPAPDTRYVVVRQADQREHCALANDSGEVGGVR